MKGIIMNSLKKAAAALAATSMVATPVAASAATAFDGARSASAVSKKNGLEGGSIWIIAVLAVAAIIGGNIIAADNHSGTPTSPAQATLRFTLVTRVPVIVRDNLCISCSINCDWRSQVWKTALCSGKVCRRNRRRAGGG